MSNKSPEEISREFHEALAETKRLLMIEVVKFQNWIEQIKKRFKK